MPTPDQFPAVSEALVAALKTLFVDQLPDIATSDREIWARVGEQRVIRFLSEKAKQQITHVFSKT